MMQASVVIVGVNGLGFFATIPLLTLVLGAAAPTEALLRDRRCGVD